MKEWDMRNLELKVHCENEERFKAIAAQAQKVGASYCRTMKQRDTYFLVPHGRLKLREWWLESQPILLNMAMERANHLDANNEAGSSGATLIAYARPNDVGSRFSEYLLSPILESVSLRLALTETLGILVVIEKVRVLYTYGITRIHLDTVKDLGTFVELETIIGEATSIEDAMGEHQVVVTALSLDTLHPIASSYSDLLLDRLDR